MMIMDLLAHLSIDRTGIWGAISRMVLVVEIDVGR
jgi:hypothetical protein